MSKEKLSHKNFSCRRGFKVIVRFKGVMPVLNVVYSESIKFVLIYNKSTSSSLLNTYAFDVTHNLLRKFEPVFIAMSC